MSDKKTEKTIVPMSKKKKATLVFIVLGLMGGGYYGWLWFQAEYHNVEIKDLAEAKEAWKKKLEQERF